ncbi:lysozyme-like protein [Rhizobium phage RHph_I42]|nr:lysozyme-like protein [Rhizobium phage RHph_I42]
MTMMITPQQVKDISLGFGRADICQAVADGITTHGDTFHLDTPIRVKHFLGQCCIESNFYRSLEENLNYRAEGLVGTFGAKRISAAQAQKVGRTPEHAADPRAIANIVYGGEWGKINLGNIGPDDGWRYRGSSIKQLTGLSNFTGFNRWIRQFVPDAPDFVAYPEALRTLEWAIWPAFYFWDDRGCYQFADNDDAKGLTRRINGGLNGVEDRIKATAVAGKVLNMPTQSVPTPVKPNQPDPLLLQYQKVMVLIADKTGKKEFNPGTPDGWNGPATRKAVEAIQAFTNLNVDGKLGPNTRKAIDILADRLGIK